jgi:glutaredoxin 3
MNIFVYTKKGCPNCVTAKQMLKARNLKFIECDMEIASVRESFFTVYPDAKQMPQIFINDQRVGGLAGLRVALSQMALDKKADNARELGLDY